MIILPLKEFYSTHVVSSQHSYFPRVSANVMLIGQSRSYAREKAHIALFLPAKRRVITLPPRLLAHCQMYFLARHQNTRPKRHHFRVKGFLCFHVFVSKWCATCYLGVKAPLGRKVHRGKRRNV